jgi:hypothetical protein
MKSTTPIGLYVGALSVFLTNEKSRAKCHPETDPRDSSDEAGLAEAGANLQISPGSPAFATAAVVRPCPAIRGSKL